MGLFALDKIDRGEFVCEYVGEVITEKVSKERLASKYANYSKFYMLTLVGKEVIDATAKGGIARFMNHSCDPNCQTSKWLSVSLSLSLSFFSLCFCARDLRACVFRGERHTVKLLASRRLSLSLSLSAIFRVP